MFSDSVYIYTREREGEREGERESEMKIQRSVINIADTLQRTDNIYTYSQKIVILVLFFFAAMFSIDCYIIKIITE